MFGKHYASLYDGSMIGAGAIVFAVWGYVIAKQEPDREVGSQVRLNPVLLAAILGESEADIVEAIKYLCSPDPRSTTREAEGRRLISVGQFDYQVVNGAKYRSIRDGDERRMQNREAKRRQRSRQNPLAGEVTNGRLVESGATEAELNRQAESTLPDSARALGD